MKLLGRLTSAEVGELGGQSSLTLVIALGATEQHGPHLPLDTDTRIAEAVAAGVVDALEHAVLGPTIAVGASGEHAGFAGTLSIGTESLAGMLVELVRGAGHEFLRVVLVNGHGGNLEAVSAAVRVCRSEGRRLDAWSVKLPGADAHAGRTETSLMLAIAPNLVRVDRAEAGNIEPIEELLPKLRREGLIGVTSNGVLGDPSGASGQEGEKLLADLIDDAAAVLSGGFSSG